MSAHDPTETSPQSSYSAANHRGALRAYRDGSGRTAAEVRPRPRTHPGDCRLCHPISRSSPPRKQQQKAIAQNCFCCSVESASQRRY
ncbi:hypothetical protein QQF64_006632 [Cirrhinus molitorella]|uniref:Uncharacterized protein n=1 Tax=Cirrhinus molitorella TaxID=172907 RepID=A0ABR3M8E7_9TELE